VGRSAISVIADWLIFLSRQHRNAPYLKNTPFLEYFDVAFRHSRYSGLTHQNVKIKAKCTVYISQIFPFQYWWIFQGHWTHTLWLAYTFGIILQWRRLQKCGGNARASCASPLGTALMWAMSLIVRSQVSLDIFSFLKNPRKTYYKNSLILTRPTPVLRKIHKMGAPLFCF